MKPISTASLHALAVRRPRMSCCVGLIFLLVCAIPQTAVGQDEEGPSPLVGKIFDPVFSPSNRALVAYSRQVEDTRELYLYNARTETVRQVTAVDDSDENGGGAQGFLGAGTDQKLSRFEGQPAWRPVLDPEGRQWFAFVSSASETGFGLFLSYVTEDGTLADRVIELPFEGQAGTPTWKPDGRRLVFSGSRTGTTGNELFLYSNMDRFLQGDGDVPSSTKAVQLTDNPNGNLYPDWSPDGQYVVYQSKQTGQGSQSNWGVNLLDMGSWAGPQGSPQPRSVRLSGQLNAYNEYRPTWSPNGRYVAFYVTQSRVGEGGENRRQDIALLSPVQGSGGRIETGRLLEGYTGQRMARNVLTNENRGPVWHPSRSTASLLYVAQEEDMGNPIYLTNATAWSDGEANFSRRLSSQFEKSTRLHKEVGATLGALERDGVLRVAFASQVGENLRLQVQEVSLGAQVQRRAYRIPREVSDQTAFFRSALFPGLGQFYRGRSTRGWLFAAAGGLALGASAATIFGYRSALDEYQQTLRNNTSGRPNKTSLSREELFGTVDGLEGAYDDAERMHLYRTIALGTLAGVWAWNLFDSLRGPGYVLDPVYAGSSVRIQRPTVKVAAHGDESAYGLALRVQF